jgi:hypothetical protein
VLAVFSALLFTGCANMQPGVRLVYVGGATEVSVNQDEGTPTLYIPPTQSGTLFAVGVTSLVGIKSIEIDGTDGVSYYKSSGNIGTTAVADTTPIKKIATPPKNASYQNKPVNMIAYWTSYQLDAPGRNSDGYTFPPSSWSGTYTATVVDKSGKTATTKPLNIVCPPN